jgi:hypothetical protein
MSVPTSISELSTTASSNVPAGSDSTASYPIDDMLRALSAFIAQLQASKMDADAEITAIAGLTSAANKLPYFTGSGTAALADLTAAGRALLDDAAASDQRTTLGLGTMAVETATNYLPLAGGTMTGAVLQPKSYQFTETDAGNSGTTKTITADNGQYQKLTMTGNCTATITSGTLGDCTLQIAVLTGTGSFTLAITNAVWPASYTAADKAISTAASATDLLVVRCRGSVRHCTLTKGFA